MMIYWKKRYVSSGDCFSPQMARVIRWNVPILYRTNAHRLLKKITEHADILTRNENGEAVIYGNAIPGSKFKS